MTTRFSPLADSGALWRITLSFQPSINQLQNSMRSFAPKTYSAGTLAYWDTFSGLVPCKVLAVIPPKDDSTRPTLRIRLTAKRGPYNRGEEHADLSPFAVVPRDRVYVRSYQYRVNTQYAWGDASGEMRQFPAESFTLFGR